MQTKLFVRVSLACGVVFGVCAFAHAQTPFQHEGLDPLHPPDSAIPNEQVDPASGTLTVIATDLVLPGNAGFNLPITRVYNSSVYPDYNDGSTDYEEDSWAGIGWKLHFGRIIQSDSNIAGAMQIEMGDGSRHALYHAPWNPNIWTTSDFWVYNPATATLQLPNGSVYTFGRVVYINDRLGNVRYVTDIHDPFGNDVSFTYFDPGGPVDAIAGIHQTLSSTESRDVTFTYDNTYNALRTMTFLNHTWTYDQAGSGPDGYSVLTTVHPPEGPPTSYEYNGGELTVLQAPFGGTITYTYADAARIASSQSTTTRVVTSRTMAGHGIPVSATWTFAYSTGSNQDTTVITCPCGGTTYYRFNGTGVNGDFSGWSAGTLAEITITDGTGTLEDRTLNWIRSAAISPDPVNGPNGLWSDGAVYRPLLSSESTTRDGSTWTMTYSYSPYNQNDYGQPDDIMASESVYFWRHTVRTFQYGFAPYLTGRVASETVTENSAYNQSDGTVSSSWNYDLSTGFLASQNIHGFTTTYGERADGNVASATDALNHTTTFDYDWGVVSGIHTPTLTTTYGVSQEGLVTSQTVGSLTTTYVYDTALRLRTVTPPFQNATNYTPDDLHGAWVKISRDQSWVEHDVDGFGREIDAFNSQGLQTWTEHDACGKVTRASDPFTIGQWTATITAYDGLGRVTSFTDSAGHATTYTYNGVVVTRTDPNGHVTAYGYRAFGDPGSSVLASVTDAAGNMTQYLYHVTGALRSVSGPAAGISRSWDVEADGLVHSSTQPESGTTTYTYDAVGNLQTITDANGAGTTLTYDANNRLVNRDAPGTVDDLAITYHDDDGTGRVNTMSGGGTTTTYSYNDASRTVTRQDVTAIGTFSSSYASDADGNLASVTYPSGRQVTYFYDGENRLTSLNHKPAGASSSTPFATSFQYADGGQLQSYITGAVTHQFTYLANRPARVFTTGGTDSLDLTYTYDNAGNITQITDPRANATQTFVPDPLDRITSAIGPWGTLSWTYDAAGNRLSETANGTSTNYTYNGATQRLTSTSGGANESFGYDNVGQLTSDGIISSYTYSPLGKLTAAAGTNMSAAYVYDAAGERVSKTVNGQTIYSIRGGGGETLSEYQSSCGAVIWTRDLIYAGGQLIGAAKAVLTQPTVSMASAAASVGEGTSSVGASVVLTTPNGAPLGCAVSVVVATSNGTATAGTNFSAVSQTITFASGSANGASQSISVPILDDHLFNGNQTFSVALSQPLGGSLGATPAETVTILEADLPTISFAASAASVSENGGTQSLIATIGTGIALPSAISAHYAFADGSALSGRNYSGAAGTVTFPAGSGPGATQSIPVTIIDDDVYSGSLTFSASLSAPSGATLGPQTSMTVTIGEGDPAPSPVVIVESPGSGSVSGSNVTVSGYAYDAHAMNGGTGVTAVNVYAYPNADLSQTPVFLGTASYGISRPGVCSGQFVNCGFSLAAVMPYTGAWLARAFALDPLGATFYPSTTTTFTVQPTPRMNVDAPQNGSVASWFTIGGWAIDAGAGSGTGVDAVDVWAYPNPGSGQNPIYLGRSYYGGSRPDVGAAYGSQFTPSGFALTANLAAGYYQLSVYAHSSVTASWSQIQVVYVSVATGTVMSVDAPANNATVPQTFGVTGWALDASSSSGDGVPFLDVWAFPANGNPAIFFGQANTVAGSRPDVGAWLQDSRFNDSGWGITNTLPPGGYYIASYPYSSVTNAFQPATVIYVTVSGDDETVAAAIEPDTGPPDLARHVDRHLARAVAQAFTPADQRGGHR